MLARVPSSMNRSGSFPLIEFRLPKAGSTDETECP